MSIIGNWYLERGRPVLILKQWSGKGPRNVLIRREDGAEVVRSFRGLRKGRVDVPLLELKAAWEA